MPILQKGLRAFLVKDAIKRVRYSTGIIQQIAVGDKLPDAEFYENFPANKVMLKELTTDKRIILFGVCGAFAPNCSKIHLPGYVANAKKFKEDGFDDIICVSVNDPYVMAAWGREHQVKGCVRMLADPVGEFIRKIGLGVELPPLGGFRSKRFSMVVTDNQVEKLNVEPDNVGLTCTVAENLKYEDEDEPITT